MKASNKKFNSIMTVHTRLPFGKYKDEFSIYELINKDLAYIEWLINEAWTGKIDEDVKLLVYNKKNKITN